MSDQRPDNPFDAMRRVIEHEANQDDDGGFFAKLGGIDPEPYDDGPTAKGLFQHMSRYETEDIPGDYGLPVRPDITRDNGGKLPTGLTTVTNRTGHGMTTDEYLEAEKQRQYGLKLATNYIRKKYGPKRKPIVKVRKTQTGWLWTCRICDHFFMSTKWSIIIKSATHHAHNHHGEKR